MPTTASSMLDGLRQSANIFVAAMKNKLGSGKYPPVISDAISIGNPINEGEGRSSITISIDLEKAPMAAAFEFGSGIHAELGDRGTYRIEPRNAPMLAFPKERWPQYEPPPAAPDVFLFTFVNHPGIVARPYMRPSIIETKPEIIKILGDSFRASILIGIREVWNGIR